MKKLIVFLLMMAVLPACAVTLRAVPSPPGTLTFCWDQLTPPPAYYYWYSVRGLLLPEGQNTDCDELLGCPEVGFDSLTPWACQFGVACQDAECCSTIETTYLPDLMFLDLVARYETSDPGSCEPDPVRPYWWNCTMGTNWVCTDEPEEHGPRIACPCHS